MRSISWLKVWYVFLVLALPAAVIYHFFPKIFECPACYLYEDIGDGQKNYYTLAWYVVHDKGWHFSGMNYPYGEHIIYTDNQPILAMALRWVHHHLFSMDRHIIGTLNMLLLVSLYLAVLFTYQLLRRWNIGRWWALASSMCIIFLSPQLLRFAGHYGLAYLCFFPLLFLQLDYLLRGPGKRWLWGVSIGVQIIIMSLCHMYFLFLSALALFAFLLFWMWYHRKERKEIRSVGLTLFLAILFPAIFLVGIKDLTDPITDRPTEPWGIDAHLIEFKTTFFSFIPPFDKAWSVLWDTERPIQERYAYTGLIGLLLLPAFLYFLFRKKEDEISTHVKAIAGAAFICWLMAAGSFYQNGFRFVWNIIPFLKQFRGLGRFGIPFYYLYTMVCSFLLWIFYIRLQNAGLAKYGKYALSIIFLVWGFEAWINMKDISGPVFHGNTSLSNRKDSYTPVLSAAGYKAEDFQAILQFPLVAVGNENFGVARGFWTLREGIHAAWELGIPMIDYSMSRTSISQGMDILGLISSPYSHKKRAEGFNDKPILLVCEEEFATPAEKYWINLGKKIGTYQSITLYSLNADVFKTVVPPPAINTADSICSGWFLDFESHPCDTAFTGHGALPIPSAPYSVWSYTDTAQVERPWIVSFWTYVDKYGSHVAVPRMMETDPNGAVTQNTGLHREHIDWAEAYGSWAEIRFPFSSKGKGYKYELFMDTPGPVIDNLLIRGANDTCVYQLPGMKLYNNIPVPQN